MKYIQYITVGMLGLFCVLTNVQFAEGQISVPGSMPQQTPAAVCANYNANLGVGSRHTHVRDLQAFLYKSQYLKVEPTGYFGPLTRAALIQYQKEAGISATGFFGPLTRAKLNEVNCIKPTVVVRTSTDKQTYAPGETIHITVTATNPMGIEKKLTWSNGCQASYKIGEFDSRIVTLCIQALTSETLAPYGSKTWTFEHVVDESMKPGTHTVQGLVEGYGSGTASITVSSTSTPAASVTVVSPAVGEKTSRNSTTNIVWKSYFPHPTFAAIRFDISVTKKYVCGGEVCPAIAHAPQSIAKNVLGDAYSWNVGNLEPGEYTLEVCMAGTTTCDTTNGTFQVL